jgi:hypothetical protein
VSATVAPPLELPQPAPLPPGLMPAPVAGEAADDITWCLAEFAARRGGYALYHAYLRGDHRLTFATKGYKAAFKALLVGLRCNLCPRMVHALTDRLKVTGFEAHDAETSDQEGGGVAARRAAAKNAWALWQDGRLDRHENRIYTEAVATGDAYLLVWPDPDDPMVPCFYPQSADQVVMRYDAERPGVPTLAAKFWRDEKNTKRYRLNLYYADRIEKYTTPDRTNAPSKAADFALLPGADGEIANPYGRVPVFHYPFEGGLGQCGQAELRDIIPLQDGMNKELCDMLVASEFGAFPQKWAIGVDPDAEEGDENALRAGIDRLVTVLNKDAKLGQFDATDLAAYRETIFAFAELMALVKGIPMHVLRMGGTIPSGESLKTAEAPLVSRVEDTQTDFGDVWEDALAFALRIAGKGDDAQLTATWRPAVSRGEKDQAETVGILRQQVGLPLDEALRLLGRYSEDEIARIVRAARDEEAFGADLAAGDGSATLRAELGNDEGQGQ